jgi:hypothetical protein
MSGTHAAPEPPGGARVSRRLLVVLAVVAAFVVGAGATEVWSRTRPAPLEQPPASVGECFAVKGSDVATYGTMTLVNTSDSPVKITDLRLVDPRGTLLTGASFLVPMQQAVVGNQAGFPPTRNLDAPGLRWSAQRLAIRGFVEPAAEAGPVNLVIGVRLLAGSADPSFARVEVDYEAGRRTLTWRSAGPVTMSTTGVSC